MKIGIDARLIGETGVGRYIRNLITHLGQEDLKNEYIVFLPNHAFESFRVPNPRWQKRLNPIPWHSIKEQVLLPFLYGKEHLDVLHVPYFTVPIFYFGKLIVTVHDLIILTHPTGKASTRNSFVYWSKYIGYRILLYLSLLRAKRVLTVSHAVEKELNERFPFVKNKLYVCYEGVDEGLLIPPKQKTLFTFPYFLIVGNVYPHKNVHVAIDAFTLLSSKNSNYKLIFVTKEDIFTERLKEYVENHGISDRVIFLHQVTDEYLVSLYSDARALLFPSLKEGFGLPILEAIMQNTPLLISDIPIFHEVVGNLPVSFVMPTDVQAWEKAMTKYTGKGNHKNRYFSSEKEKEAFLNTYSWKKLALFTKENYERCNSL